MIISITQREVVVPGHGSFLRGTNYTVSAELGKMLVERGQAVEVVPEKKDEAKGDKDAKRTAK